MGAKDSRLQIVIGAVDEASKAIKGIKKSFTEFNQGVESAQKILEGFKQAYDFSKLGAESERASFAFQRMADKMDVSAGKILNDINEATDGTVSDLELMEKASKAVTLGIPIQKIADFARIAKAAAAAMGESVDFMFDSIVTGTARQSRLILDNLGIVISETKVYAEATEKLGRQLTATEKRQAFFNAVVKSGDKIVESMGNTAELSIDKFSRMEASIDNNVRAISKGLLPAMEFLITGWSEFLNQLGITERPLTVTAENIGAIRQEMKGLVVKQIQTKNSLKELMAQTDNAGLSNEDFVTTTNLLGESIEANESRMNLLSKEIGLYEQSILGANGGLGEFIVTNKAAAAAFEEQVAIISHANETELALIQLANDASEKAFEDEAARIANLNLIKDESASADADRIENRLALTLATDEMIAQAQLETQLRTMIASKKFSDAEIKQFKKKEQQKIAFAQQAENVLTAGLNRATNEMVDIMLGGQNDLRDVFSGIAKDFLRLFITQILSDMKLVLVAKLIKLLTLFDVRENDMMAIQIGRDYARFFQQGVFDELNQGRLARAMASQTTGGALQIGAAFPTNQLSKGGTTVIIQGNVIGQDAYVKDILIPAIQNAIITKESNLAFEENIALETF